MNGRSVTESALEALASLGISNNACSQYPLRASFAGRDFGQVRSFTVNLSAEFSREDKTAEVCWVGCEPINRGARPAVLMLMYADSRAVILPSMRPADFSLNAQTGAWTQRFVSQGGV